MKNNEIVYDEGFLKEKKELSERAHEVEPIPVDEQPTEEGRSGTKPLLITIQLALCLLIALFLFIMKTTGTAFYDAFEKWYDDEMKKTLISRSAFEKVDLSAFFARSTADEIHTLKD